MERLNEMDKEIHSMYIDEFIRLVIAIDFGTSYSGYAYAFTDDRKIFISTEWPGAPAPYPKTLTNLLYSPYGTIENEKEDWGWLARQRLAKLRLERKANEYHLFKNFKMELHESKDRDTNKGPRLSAANGRNFFVIDLIADYLRLLKIFALKNIKESTGGYIRETEILWCLTIPAIWTDSSKILMRQAAQKAGLIENYDDDTHLWLVLEPEAAAWYCQEREAKQLKVDTRFMVIDCGGGTIDITAYEITADKKLREVAPGTGGPYGSTKIDLNFFQNFLKAKLSSEALDQYHDEEPIDFLEHIIHQWERKKCGFDPRTSSDITSFSISARLYKILATYYPEILKKLADEQEGEDDCIHIDRYTMEMIFQPTLKNIVKVAQEQFQKFDKRGCDYIYLVGGFSTSPLLEQYIREQFGEKTQVIKPSNPSAAILFGAILYAFSPEEIIRRTRLTYGCQITTTFQSGIHKENKKRWYEDLKRYLCEDIFDIFIKAGDIVDINARITNEYTPLACDQNVMSLKLLATKKQNVLYSDEDGVIELGELRIERSDTTSGLDWTVEVTMYFGRTEIQVEAKDIKTGNQQKTTLHFSSTCATELLGESM